MLAGRYPSRRVRRAAAPAGLGPRHRHPHRPAAARSGWRSPAAAPSPTAGCSASSSPAATAPGRRVGELDEEMVYESRVGDVFALGTSTWRIEDITHDRCWSRPRPGSPAGCRSGRATRSAVRPSSGRAVGAFVREVGRADAGRPRAPAARPGLDEWAADNLLGYLRRAARGDRHAARRPHDRGRAVPRRARRLAGRRALARTARRCTRPWALAIAARLRERYGVDVQAMHADDGIVLRLPDTESTDGGAATAPSSPTCSIRSTPTRSRPLVTEQIGGSALFASRFRECAGAGAAAAAAAPGPASGRCGSSGSGRPSCSRWRPSTRASRSCSRRSASACQDVFDVPAPGRR